MMGKLNFQVGAVSKFTKTFSESDVYLYAGIIGDFFPAHVNEIFCKTQPYKNRIVHGCLTFGLASTVSGKVAVDSGHEMVALGYDNIRFLKPVFFGDTITATYTIRALDEKRLHTTADCIMTNQHGEVVLTCSHYMKAFK